MEMKDLKVARDEKKDTALAGPEVDYPCGVRLFLEEDIIEKLGLDKLPSPGMSIDGGFLATVESASIHKGPDGTKRSLCLQLTKLGLGKGQEKEDDNVAKEKVIPHNPSKDGPSADKVLYGD